MRQLTRGWRIDSSRRRASRTHDSNCILSPCMANLSAVQQITRQIWFWPSEMKSKYSHYWEFEWRQTLDLAEHVIDWRILKSLNSTEG
jgi:hypothetical protein